MLDAHAARIEAAIRGCAVVATYALNTVQLSPNTGYVEGEIMFVDGSRLVFFEFWRRMVAGLDREKYRYHLMDANNQLLFRYDDAPHHPGVATFPHHKLLPLIARSFCYSTSGGRVWNGNASSHPSTFSLTGASAGSAVRETAHNLIRLFVYSFPIVDRGLKSGPVSTANAVGLLPESVNQFVNHPAWSVGGGTGTCTEPVEVMAVVEK
jgi:hypothetical protein